MTGLQIFKFLPAAKKEEHSNCKECGCPTCMAFALKLAKQNIEIEKCPYVGNELKELYSHSIKLPQKTIELGDLKIGGENVLYRHEKTFINKTVLAVCVDCANSGWEKEINRISDFEIKGVSGELKVDLIILKNSQDKVIPSVSTQIISYEDFKNLEIQVLEDIDFHQTKTELIKIRTRVIKEKDEKFSAPVCVWMNSGDDVFTLCTKASFYLCKYANMIVFESFDVEMYSTLLRLRENIFTDPQKSLQVESKLYEFNEPNENSIVFLTTNFALTFFAVANELESLDVPTYLIVIPADGMSVLTAWSAEKFTANIVLKTLDNLEIRDKIKTRKIIIPGLLAHMVDELNETVPDFEFIVGTSEASDIAKFVQNLKR